MMGATAILVEPPNRLVALLKTRRCSGRPDRRRSLPDRQRTGGERHRCDTPEPAAHVSCVRAQQNTPSVGRTAPLATDLS